MTNHAAALLKLAADMEAVFNSSGPVDFDAFAARARAIATDLEKAQAEPVRYIWVSGGKEFILDAQDFAHLSERQPTEAKKCYPLFAAQPPAIPISPPQKWVDFLLDDSSDKGNCSLAEFRAFANRAWEKMRSILEATEPKAVVVEGFNWRVAVQCMLDTPFFEDGLTADCHGMSVAEAYRAGYQEALGELITVAKEAAPNPETVPPAHPSQSKDAEDVLDTARLEFLFTGAEVFQSASDGLWRVCIIEDGGRMRIACDNKGFSDGREAIDAAIAAEGKA